MEPKYFLIDERLANAILNYLIEKPFKEVAPFIDGLQRLQTPEQVSESEKRIADQLRGTRKIVPMKEEV